MDSDYLLITSKSIIHWVLEFFKYPFNFDFDRHGGEKGLLA